MSRQRHGGLGLAWSAVPMRAGAGNGVTTGTSVGWLGQGGEGARVLGEEGPCHLEVCIAWEWLPVPSCRELLLKSPDHYKLCRPPAAFEWFLYAPEGDLPLKKVLSLPEFPLNISKSSIPVTIFNSRKIHII